MAELVDDDAVLIDHRGLGWEEQRGGETWLADARTAFASTADVRVEIDEVLARDGNVTALIISWRGTSSQDTGGGAFELTVGNVSVIRNGKFVRAEQFDPDDRKAILARFAELSGQAELGGGS
jgi:hypothetical protein